MQVLKENRRSRNADRLQYYCKLVFLFNSFDLILIRGTLNSAKQSLFN